MSIDPIKIAISGVGCVGGFGCGHTDFAAALQRGYTTAQAEERAHPDGRMLLPALLASTERLTDYVARRELRRIDHYARMALLGGFLALDDAGMAPAACGKLGIIVASGYGATTTTFNFLDSVIDNGDSYASPTNFSNSVHNVAAAYLSMQLQAFGPSLTVSQFELSMCSAVYSAVCWLQQGRVDNVLIGGVDERNTVLNDYCWQRSSASNAPIARIDPFAFTQHSAIAGEGAAFLLLSKADAKTPYGYITGLESGRLDHVVLRDDDASSRVVHGIDGNKCDVMVLGADGQLATAGLYSRLFQVHGTEGARARALVSCAPCYGSLPTGQAFDLVAAALMLRDRRIYGVPARDHDDVHSALDHITAVKLAADGQFGQVTLSSRAGANA